MYYARSIQKVQENLHAYIEHLVRGKYERLRFMKKIELLQPGEMIAVSETNYIMKLLLQKLKFEIQSVIKVFLEIAGYRDMWNRVLQNKTKL